jgi:hypothetical protein
MWPRGDRGEQRSENKLRREKGLQEKINERKEGGV